MKNVLIVNHTLELGGGEKLVYEISKLYLKNNIKPTILIPDKLYEEYYDKKLILLGAKIIRIQIPRTFKSYINKNILNILYWKIYLKYIIPIKFEAIMFINLSSCKYYHTYMNHKNRVYWHVGNKIQYSIPNHKYFDENIFKEKNNKLVLINKYQKQEIEEEYGNINNKIIYIKLFENE